MKKSFKDVLKDVTLVLICAFMTSLGLVGLTVALQTKPKELTVFIPSLIISWIILYPSYKHWYGVFKKLFNF